MKRLVLGLGLLGIAIGSASGCDDTRPVVGLPPDGQAGQMSQGGEAGPGGGGSAHAGTDSAGSLNQGGDGAAGGAVPGSSGAPSLGGGQSEGGQAAEVGGAGGAAAAPFAAPYAVVYAAPVEGVDTRFPKQASWQDGALAHWVGDLDEIHDIAVIVVKKKA